MVGAVESSEVTMVFLEDIQHESRRLHNILDRLRRLGRQAAEENGHPRAFVKLLGELCDGLAIHFTLEEACGYFEDAVEEAPRIAERAEALRSEHVLLFDTICEIVEEAEDAQARCELRQREARLAERFHDFDAQLQRHETLENALILEAFDDDIGVGD